MARKDLSFGCKIQSKEFHIYEEEYVEWTINLCRYFHNQENIQLMWFIVQSPLTEESVYFDFKDVLRFNTIGHPILLSDVLQWIDWNKFGIWNNTRSNVSYCETLVRIWNLNFPNYEDQSKECKTFIRNLVTNE
jgi:hypothetical protein